MRFLISVKGAVQHLSPWDKEDNRGLAVEMVEQRRQEAKVELLGYVKAMEVLSKLKSHNLYLLEEIQEQKHQVVKVE